MGLTVAALVVAVFVLQKTVIAEEIIRTVRYVPVPANLPSTKYGVLHTFKPNLPDNVALNETRINNNITENASQYEQRKNGITDLYKFSPRAYGTQYQPNTYSNIFHKYQAEQIQDKMAENYKSSNNENNNQGFLLRFENSDVVTKGNQKKNNEENQVSQVNNKNLVSDIEILESQNYQTNHVLTIKSDGKKNCAGEMQLTESKNNLHLSDFISHEHGSDVLYEKTAHIPKLHETIHHNHGAINNVPLNHNLVPNVRAPVPVSKTATYSINYLYPMDGYNVKNVGQNLFLYKANNNEEHYTQEDEEIGESDLDHLPSHSYGSVAGWVDNKFKYTATNEKEVDVGRQISNTNKSHEVVEKIEHRKTGEDFYTEVFGIKEKDTVNTEKGLASQITINDNKNEELTQLKKESSSCQIKEANGRKDIGYIIDSHDNAKEFGIQSTKLNIYEDKSDYSARDNLEVKEYLPKHIAKITNYEYVDNEDRKDVKYDLGKYDSIYSGTNKNEILSRYYAEILEHGAHHSLAKDDTQDSGYDHYGHIQTNGELYKNDYSNGRPTFSENAVYKQYRQYIKKDDSESPAYHNNAENSNHRFFEKVITIDRTEKPTENDQFNSKYDSKPSKYDHILSDDYNYSPKIYAHIEEPESGLGAHRQYDYISESGALYDGYDRSERISKYDTKLTDESYYISKQDIENDNYYAYKNIPEIKAYDEITKDFKTHEYFSKDDERYEGYEQYEYTKRDGSEYGATDNNEYIVNNNQYTREFDKAYVTKADGEYNSIPKHYAPYEASDSNDYTLKSNADVRQYVPREYVTADELKYGNYEQYKHYINSFRIKEYESNLEESNAAFTSQNSDTITEINKNQYKTKCEENQLKNNNLVLLKNSNDGNSFHDVQTYDDVTKEKNGKKVMYHNPLAESEIRLPIYSEKHYIINEPIYSKTDSEYASEIYVANEAEKDIPHGYYADMQDQYYENVHLRERPINNVQIDSIYENKNTFSYFDQSESLNDVQLVVEEGSLKDGLTHGTDSYPPLNYESKSEAHELLYSQKQYIPKEEISYETVVDSHELHNKDIDLHLRNWPVSIYKFDPEYFISVKEEELTNLSDDNLIVKININEPCRTSIFPYSENNLKEELEVEIYGDKSVVLESTDEESQKYEITKVPSKLVYNDIYDSYPESLDYHTKTNYDIKENYGDEDQLPYINSESLETPLLIDVNEEDEENYEYVAPETKCSHLHAHNADGHLKYSLQHKSDKKYSFNCLGTELKSNHLAIENTDGNFFYDTLRKPPVISVGAHLSLNGVDSFNIKHQTIVLDSDPVPETKVNEYYSGEDLDGINSAEVLKCRQCYNRKSYIPKNHKVKQFSPIPTFPIDHNYEMFSSPIKQSKLKSSLTTTFPFIQNSRFIRSSEIFSESPDSNISQRSLS